MKTCTKCKTNKPLTEFSNSKSRKDGKEVWCKVCKGVQKKAWREKNKEVQNKKERERYYANIEDCRRKNKEWHYRNPERSKANRSRWATENKAKKLASSRQYQMSKLNATPEWLDELDQLILGEFYQHRQDLSEATGVEHHVDHIIPIRGEAVCGLHVPNNLQILTCFENASKGNRYEP